MWHELKNENTGEIFELNLASPVDLNNVDFQYYYLLTTVLKEGRWKQNRTGIKTLSTFNVNLTFKNIEENFPLITTKKVYYKGVLGELLWFLEGNTNKKVLREKYKTTIWDEWGDDETGELGPIYGYQWNFWNKIDPETKEITYINQLKNIIDKLRNNPDDRRLLVSAWNPGDIDRMALPPCHWAYQLYSEEISPGQRKLHLLFFMRSLDTFLGAPFDIASYGTLLKLIAQQTNHIAGDLHMSIGDAHIYENHMPYVKELLSRKSKGLPPQLEINKKESLWDYTFEDFKLKNYEAHPNWKNVPVAV